MPEVAPESSSPACRARDCVLRLAAWLGVALFLALSAALLSGFPLAGSGRAAKGADMNATKTGPDLRTAVFAGGCFWCTESDFVKVPGVVRVVSGYAGGRVEHPSYEQVSTGETGHQEAVQVVYDPARVSYALLLDWYWRHVDPTDPGGQFFDRGDQYRTAIFVADEAQRSAAEASKARLAASRRFQDRPIVTEIRPLGRFWPAEAYHQNFHETNAPRYCAYRAASGRDAFLDHVWDDDKDRTDAVLGPVPATDTPATDVPATGTAPAPAAQEPEGPVYQGYDRGAAYARPPDEALRRELPAMAYQVTRCSATEPPFRNAYWDNHAEGLYVDVVSGEPLFSSRDKFDSGTGWPSFTRPVDPAAVTTRTDGSLGMTRTEARSAKADSHLGHVFDDGPGPTGRRWCINSASLRFIPKADLQRQGYGAYLKLFE